MKVFFTSTPKGEERFGKFYKQIYDVINKLGYENISDDIVKISTEDYENMTMSESSKIHNEYFKREEKAMQSADICIFEVSFPTLGLGYQVQRSLQNNKPTMLLHHDGCSPYFLVEIEDEKLLIKSYNGRNLEKVVKEALDTARERRDKRFNFFLSPKLLDYIDQASVKEGITKSKFIRNLIVDRMRFDKDQSSKSDEEL